MYIMQVLVGFSGMLFFILNILENIILNYPRATKMYFTIRSYALILIVVIILGLAIKALILYENQNRSL